MSIMKKLNVFTVNNKEKHFKLGVIITLLSGIFWGVSATVSESLLHSGSVSPLWLAKWRLFLSGIILTVIAYLRGKKNILDIWKNRNDTIKLLLFTFFGLTANSVSYQMAVKYTNGATATVMQYIGPVFILLGTCIYLRRFPTRKESIAIIFVLIGTTLISTSGGEGFSMSPQGFFWAMMAAVTLAIYNVLPIGIIRKWGSQLITAYGMLLGGSGCMFLFKTSTFPILTGVQIFEMALLIIIGTVIPYSLYMKGIELIGPVKTSMLVAIEPIAATVFTASILNTQFQIQDLIGFGFITLTILILAKPA